jgi:general secretion pathway protein C
MVAGRDFAQAMRGGVLVACELACWSALGVSLAALMWSVVEPKGELHAAAPSPLAHDPSRQDVSSDEAMASRLSVAADPFASGAEPGAAAGAMIPEASGYTLHATRAWADGGGSAIIAVSGSSQSAYAVGEDIATGVRLAMVTTDHVELDMGGQRMRLSFPGSQQPDVALAARIVDTPADFRASAASAGPLLLNAPALQPVSRDGRPAGFEIMPNASGSLLASAGLRPGDIVVSINGVAAASGGDLSDYRDQLSSGQPLLIRYERGGRIETATIGTRP